MRNNHSVARNILASDLGLIAKGGNDGSLLIAVSDLRTTEPLSGVKLDVLDLQRKSLGQAVVTDRRRSGHLPARKARHKPFLLVASQRHATRLPCGWMMATSLSVSEFDVQGDCDRTWA
jgi:uncharacterized protein YfaS (alpha-2-macroglobulin family)